MDLRLPEPQLMRCGTRNGVCRLGPEAGSNLACPTPRRVKGQPIRLALRILRSVIGARNYDRSLKKSGEKRFLITFFSFRQQRTTTRHHTDVEVGSDGWPRFHCR